MLIISTSSFAETAALLEKGDSAPFSGTLITNERVDKLVKAEKANIVLKDLRIAEKELTEYHRSKAREARTELNKVQLKGYMNTILAFTVGVIVTGFAFKVNQKIGDI